MKANLPRLNVSEAALLDRIVRLGPWLSPLPAAWFVADACRDLLDVPPLIAWIIAAVIEFLALAASHTALEFQAWNSRLTDDETEWRAPLEVVLGFGALYLVVTITLTVVLKSIPSLASQAPAIFPFLSLAGVALLALARTHRRLRVQAKAEVDAEAKRQQSLAVKREERHRRRQESLRLEVEVDAQGDGQPEAQPVVVSLYKTFARDARSGAVTPSEMTGGAIAERYGVSASTGRRWKRSWAAGVGQEAEPERETAESPARPVPAQL